MVHEWLIWRRATLIAVAALSGVATPSLAPAQPGDVAPPGDGDEPAPQVDADAEPSDDAPAEAPTVTPGSMAAAPAPAAEPVRYGEVDAATVRVFSVGPVGVDRFELDRSSITFAITNAGHGSGFAVGSGRLIATARHVVEGAVHVVVRRPGESGFSVAQVVHESEDADVAILVIEEVIPPLQLADDAAALRVRATAFAVGYPLDPTRKLAQSARGIIAGNLDDGTVQIDMDINPGNSGGPLLDAEDRVIGMVVARAQTSAGAQGIGYAVPIRKVAEAVREAERELASGGRTPATGDQRRAAIVVDELVQAGALRSLRDASDLEGGLHGENLERGLDDLSVNVQDPDLLAFISGNLWNASLVLRHGRVEQIGENEISRAEAHRLADRFEREAIALSRKAYRRDPDVIERSPFVAFARGRTVSGGRYAGGAPPGGDRTASSGKRRMPIRGWGGLNVRLNPDTGSAGGGGTAGLYQELTHIRDDERVGRVIPVIGAAFGLAIVEAGVEDEPYRHSYLSAEVGALIRPSERFELGGVYAPSLYGIRASDGTGDASELVFGHARVWASAVFDNLTVSTGLRVLGGPTVWWEPVTLGFIY